MELKQMIIELSSAAGVGSMTAAAETAARLLGQLCPELEISLDPVGNLTALRKCGKSGAPLIMLEAHIDEIGFVVTAVDEGGFLHVDLCGRVDPRALPAAEVAVYASGTDSPLTGIFCSTPPHLAGDDSKTLLPIDKQYIDIGMSAAEARKAVKPGDFVGFAPGTYMLHAHRISGKSMDDRAGAAAVIRAMQLLGNASLDCDVAAVLCVQEELGCLGSRAAAYALNPDYAIAVDVSFAHTPDAIEHQCGKLGAGPMLGYSPILNDAMTTRLREIAASRSIPLQHEVMGGRTGTDADSISNSRAGICTALLSVPLRYMHTPVETVDLRDVEHTAQLMAAYVKEPVI